jgi:hypothetical protein
MKYYTMKMYGGVDLWIHVFFTLQLVEGEWSASRSGHFNRGKQTRYPFDRKLGGPQRRSERHGEGKILDPIRPQTLTPQLSSQ